MATVPQPLSARRERAVVLLLVLCLALSAATLVFLFRGAPPCCRYDKPGVRLAAAGVVFYAAALAWRRRRGLGPELRLALLAAAGAHAGFLTGGIIRFGTVCPLCAATAGACLAMNVACGHRPRLWVAVALPAAAVGALVVLRLMP